MPTIRVVLDKGLLRAADQAARSRKQSRSALIRDALREHVKRLTVLDAEERDRQGYQDRPSQDYRCWESAATWPRD